MSPIVWVPLSLLLNPSHLGSNAVKTQALKPYLAIAALAVLPAAQSSVLPGLFSGLADKAATGAVVGMTGNALIDRAEQAINGGLATARSSGDALAIRIAEEALLVLRALREAYSGMLNETLDKLDPELNRVLTRIDRLSQSIDRLPSEAGDLQDLLYLDASELLDRLPLIESKVALRRIEGAGILQKKSGVYVVSFTGNAFEPGVEATLVVDGKTIGTPLLLSRKTMTMAIDVESLGSKFREDQLSVVSYTLTCIRKKKRMLWSNSQETVLSYNGNLVLLPQNPLTLVRAVAPVYTEIVDFESTKGFSSRPVAAQPSGSAGPIAYPLKLQLPEGWVIVPGSVHYRSDEHWMDGWSKWGKIVVDEDAGTAAGTYYHRIHDKSRAIWLTAKGAKRKREKTDVPIEITEASGARLETGTLGYGRYYQFVCPNNASYLVVLKDPFDGDLIFAKGMTNPHRRVVVSEAPENQRQDVRVTFAILPPAWSMNR